MTGCKTGPEYKIPLIQSIRKVKPKKQLANTAVTGLKTGPEYKIPLIQSIRKVIGRKRLKMWLFLLMDNTFPAPYSLVGKMRNIICFIVGKANDLRTIGIM